MDSFRSYHSESEESCNNKLNRSFEETKQYPDLEDIPDIRVEKDCVEETKSIEPEDSNLQPEKSRVVLEAKTWINGTHGLFSYDTKEIKNKTYRIYSPGKLIRNGLKINYKETTQEYVASADETVLLNLENPSENTYTIKPVNTNKQNDRIWTVIKELGSHEYKIEGHDIFKLGKMKFRVKEFRTPDCYFTETDSPSPHEGFDKDDDVEDPDQLSDEELKIGKDNCIFCRKTNDFVSNLVLVSCSCGEPSEEIEIKRPDDPEVPYIIIEWLNPTSSLRTVHTIVFEDAEEPFCLGRGHEADLRINCISVSRKHAAFKFREDGFYMVDLKNKYGTLVLERGALEICEGVQRTIQIGHTVIDVKFEVLQQGHSFKPPIEEGNLGANVANANEGHFYEDMSNSLGSIGTDSENHQRNSDSHWIDANLISTSDSNNF
ncbi:unnamed protein product [Moneuplotes crassus]|uniref:FHA domain-containing protein n=1 Tax=Euplotes crassus TaxID=5936 RepID=A0AAD1U9F9_EUPCR|nr:unnamed protein product [Moneuplotes crassus]